MLQKCDVRRVTDPPFATDGSQQIGEDSKVGVNDRSLVGLAMMKVGRRSGDKCGLSAPRGVEGGDVGDSPRSPKHGGIPYKNATF